MAETRIRGLRGRNRGPETPLRVLVVEDSADDAALLLRELKRGGYEPHFERVETPEAMRDALDRERWDVVVADHDMPRFSALAALGVLKERGSDLPVIIVSRRIGEEAAVEAMRAGARDYVVKRNLRRLCPAVERELGEAAERRERRRSEAALGQSEELYRAVVEQPFECVFLVDAGSKRLLEANGAFRELLGYTSEELEEMTLYDFVAHDRASVDENIRLLVEKGRHDIGERRYRRKDDTLVDVEVRANVLLLDGREVMCCVSHDVTERKRAEQRRDVQYAVSRVLAESVGLEDAAPRLLETIGTSLGWELGSLWMVDRSAGVLRCEELWHAPSVVAAEFEAASLQTSLAPGHGLPGRVWGIGKPLWIPDVLEDTNFSRPKSAAREGLRGAFAFPIRDEGRVLGVIEFFSYKVLPPDGDLLQTVDAVGNQISQFVERKRTEAALSERERHFRQITEGLPQLVWTCRADGLCDYLSPQWVHYTGIPEAEQLGFGWLQQLHPDDHQRTIEAWERAVEADTTFDVEFRIRGAEGNYRWFKTRAVPVRDEGGRTIKWFGTNTDIDDQKRAEESLRCSEASLALAQRIAHVGSWELDLTDPGDLNSNALRWSDECFRIFGYAPGEVEVTNDLFFRTVHPDDRAAITEAVVAAIRERATYSIEHRLVLRDGTERVVYERGDVVCDEGGRPLRLAGTVQDITERKQAEEALRRQADLLEQTHDAIFVREMGGGIVYWNHGAQELYGWSRDEALGRASHELLDTEHQKSVQESEAVLRREGRWEGELVHTTRDGRRITVESRHVTVRYGAGPTFVLETNRDITERKKMYEELEESYILLRSVVEGATDAIFVKDARSRYLMVNSAAARVMGWPAEEIVGKDDTELYPPEVARPLMETDRRVLETGETHALEENAPVGGAMRTFLSTKSVFRDHRGEVAGIVGVSTDVTERKRVEEKAREIKEAERRRIAAELHDEVLQDMVHGLQETQIARLVVRDDGQDDAPDLEESLETIVDALRRSVEGLRAAIFELHLEETLERSIISSIESLVEFNRRLSRKRYEVYLNVEGGFPESLDAETGRNLVRIIQEALSNARRHSDARNVWVTLRTNGDDLCAEVADDGRGFEVEGARGGVGTSAMRRRALELGGEFEIASVPGAGTLVRFRGPAGRLLEG